MYLFGGKLSSKLSPFIAVFLFSCVLLTPARAAQQTPSFYSQATDIETGELLYQEVFYISSDELLVYYYDANNQFIAERKVFEPKQIFNPNFYLKDYRLDSEVGVRQLDGGQEMFLRKPGKDTVKTKAIDAKGDVLVSDAGFNNLILQNWQALVEQEQTVSFKFTFPNRLLLVSMNLKRLPCENDDKNVVCISLGLDNWLFSKVAGQTLIRYAKDTQQLLSFTGTSNIATESGKPLKARIDYFYSDFDTFTEQLAYPD